MLSESNRPVTLDGDNLTLPCSTLELIPQKGKMGFKQTLFKAELHDILAIATIWENNIFLNDFQELSNSVLVEYVNQVVAATLGYHGMKQNKPVQKGFFVGLQEAKFLSTVYLGDCLTIHGQVTEEIAQVSFVQGVIYRNHDKIAELLTKLYKIKNSAEFDTLTNLQQSPGKKDEFLTDYSQIPALLVSKLQRNLFTFLDDLKHGHDFIIFTIRCNENFAAFDGHFPEAPILPGIVLLEIAELGLTLFMNQRVKIQSIQKMKISGMVQPGQMISCNIKINRQDSAGIAFSTIIKDQVDREISRFNGCFKEGIE